MIYVNARYRTAGAGGFARYGEEVARRLPGARVVDPPALATHPLAARSWEQTVLPRRARDGVLLSPANSGPLHHPRHVLVLHDVLALQRPDLVSQSFAALQQRLVPQLVRRCARVVTVSRTVADQLLHRFELRWGQVECVPPGVAEVFCPGDQQAARRRLGLAPDHPVVGGLVSSVPRKNSDALIRVLRSVRRSVGCEAIVAGFDGPARVFGSRASRPTSPDVRDLGALDDLTLADFYRALDVFVFLSHGEGFGLPPAEAAACGTPVVSTSVPAVTEHLREAVVEVDDAAEAFVAVRRLLADREHRADAAAAGIDCSAPLTWERSAAGIADVLTAVGDPT